MDQKIFRQYVHQKPSPKPIHIFFLEIKKIEAYPSKFGFFVAF